MHIKTLSGWLGFALELCAGAAVVIWPENLWIAWIIFIVGSLLMIGSIIWWLITNYRTKINFAVINYEWAWLVVPSCVFSYSLE